MPIIHKSSEPMIVNILTGLIYGDPQSGKTTLASSAKKPLILDSDRGAYRALHRPDTLEVNSWADILETVDNAEIMAEYDTIIIDTVGTALDFLAEHVGRLSMKNSNSSGGLSPQGWGLLKNEFQSLANKLRVRGKNILFLAHAREERDGDVRYYRPDIQGGSKELVFRICDFIGYAYRTNATTRIVDFSCVERAMVKDTANVGKIIIPDLTEQQPFFENLTAKMLDGINNKTQAQQDFARIVSDFRATVATLTTAEEFTAQIPVISDLKTRHKALSTQCWKILETQATAQELEFNKEQVVFVQKKTPFEIFTETVRTFNDRTNVDEFNAALQQARDIAVNDKNAGKAAKAELDFAARELGFEYDARKKCYVGSPVNQEAEEWA